MSSSSLIAAHWPSLSSLPHCPMLISPTLDLARQLIARRSGTPDDAGCQEILEARLSAARISLRDDVRQRRQQSLGATRRRASPRLLRRDTPTSCPPARSMGGIPIRLCQRCATVSSMGAAPRT